MPAKGAPASAGMANAAPARAVAVRNERREIWCMISRLSNGQGVFSELISVRNTARQHLFAKLVLVGLDVVVLHHFAPSLHLVANEGTLDVRAAEGQRDLLGFDQLLADAFLAQRCGHLTAETLDDRLRRTG